MLWEPGELSPPELAVIANREHALALDALDSVIVHAATAGEALIQAKASLAHGEWLPWLEEKFEGSEDTAQGYMKIARNTERVRYLLAENPDLSLRQALKAIGADNGRPERDAAIRERRAKQLQEARESMADDGSVLRLEVGDVRSWRPGGVDAVITDPPYVTDDAVDLHEALGEFAVDVLPDGGALVILTWQPLLPEVMQVLDRPDLVYRWTAAWLYETSARTPERKPRVFDGWKPILVYHKGHIPEGVTYLYDTVNSPDADKDHHEWGQSPEGFMQLVRAFTEPGQTVCDPFLGGGTTAVAALAETRRFVGCDIEAEALEITRRRLAQGDTGYPLSTSTEGEEHG